MSAFKIFSINVSRMPRWFYIALVILSANLTIDFDEYGELFMGIAGTAEARGGRGV
jgi:hypothetical protein